LSFGNNRGEESSAREGVRSPTFKAIWGNMKISKWLVKLLMHVFCIIGFIKVLSR
jgi:hypothetical protein